MIARDVYKSIDENSEPGAPLAFYSAVSDPYCPPPFEDCPFFIAPGYTYSISLDHHRRYTAVVLRHDPNGIEVTKESLLDVIEPFTYKRRPYVVLQVFDVEDNDYCFFLDGHGLGAKMEHPEPNVFYCYGVTWPAAEMGGGHCCSAA